MARMLSEEETIVLYEDSATVATAGPGCFPSQTRQYLYHRVGPGSEHLRSTVLGQGRSINGGFTWLAKNDLILEDVSKEVHVPRA